MRLRCAISTATVYVREVVDKYLGLRIRRPHASLARLAPSFLSRRYATLVHAGRRRPPVDPVHPRRGGARSPRCYNMMRRRAGCYSYKLLSSIVIPTTCLLFFYLFLGLQFFVAHVHSFFLSFTCTHYMHSYIRSAVIQFMALVHDLPSLELVCARPALGEDEDHPRLAQLL